MKYKIFKLSFKTAVHFGDGRLDGCEGTFCADRLFSALYSEAIRIFGESTAGKLYDEILAGKLAISDGMPYTDETLYVPKPMMRIESGEQADSKMKKAFKKLLFIPYDKIDDLVLGKIDAESENDKLSKIGRSYQKVSVSLRNDASDDSLPFNVGTYSFNEGSGLYFILGYEDDDSFYFIDDIMYSLGYTGIGGKLSAGFGKFTSVPCDMPSELADRMDGDFDRYISLSVSMANDEEMEKALDGAGYSLVKRSGFVGSYRYSDTFRKKKDVYCFAGGSCFKNKFSGKIFDVSGSGKHPVYRYAVPLFMGVNLKND